MPPPLRKSDSGIRFWNRAALLLISPLEYFWKFRWKKQLTRAAFFQEVWQSGWVGRAIFLVLLGLILLAPFPLALPETNLATGAQDVAVEPTAADQSLGITVVKVGLYLLAWSLVTAALSRSPLWMYVLGAAYLLGNSILVLGAKQQTLWHVLPTLWLWGLAAWKVWRPMPRERFGWLWFLLFSYNCGWVIGGPSGLRRLIWGGSLTPEFKEQTQVWLGLGGVALAALWVLVVRFLPKKAAAESAAHGNEKPTVPGFRHPFAVAWLGSLVVHSASIAVCLLKDRAMTETGILDQAEFLSFLATYFFVWVGGSVAGGSYKTAAWAARRAVKILTPGVAAWGFILLLLVALVAQAFIGYPEWSWLHDLVEMPNWAFLSNPSVLLTHHWHFWVTLWCVGWVVFRLCAGGRGFWLLRLATWWFTAFLVIAAFWHSIVSLAENYKQTRRSAFLGMSGLTVLLGLLWAGGNLNRRAKASFEDRWKELAWLAGLLALAIVLQSRDHQAFLPLHSMALANGLFYLALPRIFYAKWSQREAPANRLTLVQEIFCFAVGILGICPLIYWKPWGPWALVWFIPVLFGVLVVIRLRLPMLSPLSLGYAGVLLAVGAVFQYSSRGFPEFPVNPWLSFSVLRDTVAILIETQPEMYTKSHFALLLGAIALGGMAGAGLGRVWPQASPKTYELGPSVARSLPDGEGEGGADQENSFQGSKRGFNAGNLDNPHS